MLKRVLLVLSLGVLLATAFVSAGCASSNSLKNMLAKVPGDTTSLKYVDVKALRNDAGLSDQYAAWKSSAGSRLEAYGIDRSAVDTFAFGTGPSTRFTVVVGDFDLDGARDELTSRHYDQDTYNDVEVWQVETGWSYEPDTTVALMERLIVVGNEAGVQGCIKVIKGDKNSWLNKTDIRDVVDRLPVGLSVNLGKSDLAGLLIDGFQSYGVSAGKQDSDTLGITGVAKFEDSDSADSAQDAVDNVMEAMFKEVKIVQEGAYLKATAELAIHDSDSLFQSA